jgi:hypothetical protein
MSVEEVAAELNLSPATILRDWNAAKAWLYSQLSLAGERGPSELAQ